MANAPHQAMVAAIRGTPYGTLCGATSGTSTRNSAADSTPDSGRPRFVRRTGVLAINVMRAVSEYGPSVTKALECGIDAVVVGAGLPLDLPDQATSIPLRQPATLCSSSARMARSPSLRLVSEASSAIKMA